MESNKKLAASLAAVIGLSVMGLGPAVVLAQAPIPLTAMKHQERHPDVRIALRALMRARMALSHSSHDFNGHREQALDLTNQAIAQAQQALQDDHH